MALLFYIYDELGRIKCDLDKFYPHPNWLAEMFILPAQLNPLMISAFNFSIGSMRVRSD